MQQPMTIKDLKKHISFWEEHGAINDSTEVTVGKIGSSALIDGPEVQKKVTDTDIQVMSGSNNGTFTIAHQ